MRDLVDTRCTRISGGRSTRGGGDGGPEGDNREESHADGVAGDDVGASGFLILDDVGSGADASSRPELHPFNARARTRGTVEAAGVARPSTFPILFGLIYLPGGAEAFAIRQRPVHGRQLSIVISPPE
jgi:hypothetical protein